MLTKTSSMPVFSIEMLAEAVAFGYRLQGQGPSAPPGCVPALG